VMIDRTESYLRAKTEAQKLQRRANIDRGKSGGRGTGGTLEGTLVRP